jgi:hypothetical protein
MQRAGETSRQATRNRRIASAASHLPIKVRLYLPYFSDTQIK